jgi:hypothetical protein
MRLDIDPVGFALGVIALPLLLVEWTAALAATAVLAAWRTAARRPWSVEAVLDDPTERRLTWAVVGWGAAGRRAEEVRSEIAAGRDPSSTAHRRAIGPRRRPS